MTVLVAVVALATVAIEVAPAEEEVEVVSSSDLAKVAVLGSGGRASTS